MMITIKPRRYFFVEDDDGVIQYTFAPIAEMQLSIEIMTRIVKRDGFTAKEVAFTEWLPVFWADSEYGKCGNPVPVYMTEEHFLRNQYL